MLAEWLRGVFGGPTAPGPSSSLDGLLDELAKTQSLERRRLLWGEIVRKFIHDVDRACRIAGDNSRETASRILDEALRGVGPEPAKYFSRELVRIMRRHVDEMAVRKVLRSIYLRQFLANLPPTLVAYAEGILDQEGHFEWLAERRGEDVGEVRRHCQAAFEQLPNAIEREYTDEEVAERTDGIWTMRHLKERSVP